MMKNCTIAIGIFLICAIVPFNHAADEDDDLLLLIPSIVTGSAGSGEPEPEPEITNYFARRIQGTSLSATRSNFLEALISPAYAQFVPSDSFFDILAVRESDTTYRVTYLSNNELNVREGILNIDGTTGDLIFDDVLSCATGQSITASIQSVSDTSISLIFNFGTDDLEFMVPAALGEITTMCPA